MVLRKAQSMNALLRTALAVAGVAIATQAAAQVTFYEREGFHGRSFTTQRQIGNFGRYGFNDRASSAEVVGERWEVCEDVRFRGRCIALRPGRYPSLAAMGLNDRVSSARALGANERIRDERFAPAPQAMTERHDYRRRHDERLFEADVTSVHAVVGPPTQRCWVEHQQIAPEKSGANVPGAIAGAVIGGILGHQVGNGRGQDLATVGGAVAGAAIGANVGRNSGQPAQTQDVKHCESVPSQARPEYWDVTYNFRGEGHRMQATAPPGATVTVNAQGEPRE